MCNEGVFVCIPWINLEGITNVSIVKSARYADEIKSNSKAKEKILNRNELEVISKDFNIKYLLAIINSNVIKRFLNQNRRNDIQLYPDDWKAIPINEIPLEEQQKYAHKVEQILSIIDQPLKKAEVETLEIELNQMINVLYES